MTKTETILFAVLTLSLGIGLNYLLAMAGEPRSLWLFRDVLRIM